MGMLDGVAQGNEVASVVESDRPVVGHADVKAQVGREGGPIEQVGAQHDTALFHAVCGNSITLGNVFYGCKAIQWEQQK